MMMMMMMRMMMIPTASRVPATGRHLFGMRHLAIGDVIGPDPSIAFPVVVVTIHLIAR